MTHEAKGTGKDEQSEEKEQQKVGVLQISSNLDLKYSMCENKKVLKSTLNTTEESFGEINK